MWTMSMLHAIAVLASLYAAAGSPAASPTYAPTMAPTAAPIAGDAAGGDTIMDVLVGLDAAGQYEGRFSTLIAALELTGLDEALSGTEMYTLLAPNNKAFKDAGVDKQTLKDPKLNTKTLENVLLYHVVLGEYTLKEIKDMTSLATVEGQDIEVEKRVLNGYANLRGGDYYASNGIIQMVDAVLAPPGK